MRTICPHCRNAMEVEQQYAGQDVRCACGQTFRAVPAASPAGAAPPYGWVPPVSVPSELAPYAQGLDPNQVAMLVSIYKSRAKDTIVFVLLAALLGEFGAHWFYMGNNGRAVTYLLVSVLTCGIGAVVILILSIIEAVDYQTHLRPVNAVAAQEALDLVRTRGA